VSLRARLLAGLAVVALVLVAACALVTRTTEAYLVAQVDERLERTQGPGVAVASPSADPFAGLPPSDPAPAIGQPDDSEVLSPFFIGLVEADGTVVPLISPTIDSEDQVAPTFDGEALLAHLGEGAFTLEDDEGERFRASVSEPSTTGDVVVLAQSLGEVDTAVDRLVLVETVAVAVVLLVLALVCWWVLHLGVRPLKQMTETATQIADGDLSHRVAEGKPGTEVAELGDALNRMLASIEVAFDERSRSEAQVRRFVGDASHELRTPVATVRGYAELYRSGGLDDPHELDEAMRRTEAEAIRMGALVDDLLRLARLDQGRPLEHEPLDVVRMVQDVVRDARAQDPERTIAAEVPEQALVVPGDDHQLRQVLTNLVGNAMVHTAPGTPIEVVAAGDGDGRVQVAVVDHGEGMAPEVAAHAFERFYRADPSRTRHRGGSGLGLAIVEAVVQAHDGDVSLAETPGGGTTAAVHLPVCS
jgi:two-component system OmpR family sensor kinase